MISAQQHFGPEPKLLDANNLSSSRQKAIFRPLGSYAAHTNAINFRIPFEFGKFLYDFSAARSNMTKYTNRVSSYSQDKFNRISKLHKDTLTDLKQEYLDIISVLPTKAPTTPNQSRTKRFFGIAIATASLGVSLANRYSITKLESQMANMQEKTDMLVKIEHVNQNHLKQVDDRLANIELLMSQVIADDSAMVVKTCDYIKKHFQQGNNMVRDVIASAMNHRLAPGALHISAMNDIIDHVKSVADKKGYINFINSPADLYQVEVSSVYHPQTKTFALILHVPIVHPDNLMTLSQYIPLPLVHNHTANITLTPDTRGVDILAMGSTQLYNTLTASDLANCLHLGNTFFAKGGGSSGLTLRTAASRHCISEWPTGLGLNVSSGSPQQRSKSSSYKRTCGPSTPKERSPLTRSAQGNRRKRSASTPATSSKSNPVARSGLFNTFSWQTRSPQSTSMPTSKQDDGSSNNSFRNTPQKRSRTQSSPSGTRAVTTSTLETSSINWTTSRRPTRTGPSASRLSSSWQRSSSAPESWPIAASARRTPRHQLLVHLQHITDLHYRQSTRTSPSPSRTVET